MGVSASIFLSSLVWGLGGGSVALRLGFWLVERWLPGEPLAPAFALLATPSIGVATAVTAGVLMGKKDR